MSNYSILERNILMSLHTDGAQEEFLWACGLPNADRYKYRAEAYARTVDQVLAFALPFADAAAKLHGLTAIPDGLDEFFQVRLRNYLGAGVKQNDKVQNV